MNCGHAGTLGCGSVLFGRSPHSFGWCQRSSRFTATCDRHWHGSFNAAPKRRVESNEERRLRRAIFSSASTYHPKPRDRFLARSRSWGAENPLAGFCPGGRCLPGLDGRGAISAPSSFSRSSVTSSRTCQEAMLTVVINSLDPRNPSFEASSERDDGRMLTAPTTTRSW